MIKNSDEIDGIKDVLLALRKKKLIQAYRFIYSLQTNNCYIMYDNDLEIRKTLRKHVDEIGSDETKMLKLLLLINNTFISNGDIRKNLYFDKSKSTLDYLYVTDNGSSVWFNDIASISSLKTETCTEFRYPLAIMQSIEKFINNNGIDVEDIYKCKFMKLFSASFARDIINYLKTQECTSRGVIGKLKNTLSEEHESRIEFLENISSNSEMADRITFFSGINMNEAMKQIVNNQKVAAEENGKSINTRYVSLGAQVKSVVEKDAIFLSESAINKLFYHFNLTNKLALLIPEKLIISKDFTNDENYQIIGIVWTRSKLYSFSHLIKERLIDVSQMYKVITNLLCLHKGYGYSISKGIGGVDAVLIDDDFNVVFNCACLNKTSDLFAKNGKGLKKYYKYITKVLEEQFSDYLDGFSFFSYENIYFDDSSTEELKKCINLIQLCQEHKKWYAPFSMCPECEKIYTVTSTLDKREKLYFSGVGDFEQNEEGRILRMCKINVCEVKAGIENGIYEKFGMLAPKKITFEGPYNFARRVASGIEYDNYDFSNVLELDSFKTIHRLKVVLVLYKKLLPHILVGSFIAKDKRIFTTMFMDKTMKGKIIIPNLHLLKCRLILSSNLKEQAIAIKNTKELFASFLVKYITSDLFLGNEFEKGNEHLKRIIEDIKNYDFNEHSIREYLKTKDCYCKVHGIYYSSEDLICPECVKAGILKEVVTIYDKEYFEELKLHEPDYEGGEANLYFCENSQVQKIFNDDVDLAFKTRIIGKALQKAKQLESFNNEHDDIKFVPINRVLFSRENNVLKLEGYTEECINDSFKISSLREKEFVADLGYERQDIIEILIKVCKGIKFLHSIGGFIGDLNGGNILIKDKKVYIIDLDGMSFDEVKNCVYTNMYIYPPSAESKNITAADDWYSFAIQAFYYLTYSHPFRGVCEKRNIPVNEVERMKEGYSVLGKHGIKTPNISIGWDFMPNYMIDFFIKTFEGNKRENMLPILTSFLQKITKNMLRFKKITRSRDVGVSITENSYIDADYNFIYKEEIKLKLHEDVRVKMCGDNFIIFCNNCTYVFNDKTGNLCRFYKTYTANLFYAKDNKIYYTTEDKSGIFVDELHKNGEITTNNVKKTTTNVILNFTVSKDDELVFVESNDLEKTVDIYFNMIKITGVPKILVPDETKILISYDEVHNKWMVICCGETATGITFDKAENGAYNVITFPEPILSATHFFGNVLYYIENGKICYYNVNKETLSKKECDVANHNSRVQREGNKFVINNEEASYMYFKS